VEDNLIEMVFLSLGPVHANANVWKTQARAIRNDLPYPIDRAKAISFCILCLWYCA
jgi:hypothetical protein